MTTSRQWADQMVKGIAAAAKDRRLALGLKAADLSERTAKGKPLSRAVISDLETGRKKTLDISELVTLASALECSPLSLLFPNALGETEELPGQMTSVLEVLRWWVDYDEDIRIAADLARVERQLDLRRTHLKRAELYSPDDNHDRKRAEIELLDADRQRLVDAYRAATEKRSPDA